MIRRSYQPATNLQLLKMRICQNSQNLPLQAMKINQRNLTFSQIFNFSTKQNNEGGRKEEEEEEFPADQQKNKNKVTFNNGEDIIKYFNSDDQISMSYCYSNPIIYKINDSYLNMQTKLTSLDFLPPPLWLLATATSIYFGQYLLAFAPFTYMIQSCLNVYSTYLYTQLSTEFQERTIKQIRFNQIESSNINNTDSEVPEQIELCTIDNNEYLLKCNVDDISFKQIVRHTYENDEIKGSFYLIDVDINIQEASQDSNSQPESFQLLINRRNTYIENLDLLKFILKGNQEKLSNFHYCGQQITRKQEMMDRFDSSLSIFNFFEEKKEKKFVSITAM